MLTNFFNTSNIIISKNFGMDVGDGFYKIGKSLYDSISNRSISSSMLIIMEVAKTPVSLVALKRSMPEEEYSKLFRMYRVLLSKMGNNKRHIAANKAISFAYFDKDQLESNKMISAKGEDVLRGAFQTGGRDITSLLRSRSEIINHIQAFDIMPERVRPQLNNLDISRIINILRLDENDIPMSRTDIGALIFSLIFDDMGTMSPLAWLLHPSNRSYQELGKIFNSWKGMYPADSWNMEFTDWYAACVVAGTCNIHPSEVDPLRPLLGEELMSILIPKAEEIINSYQRALNSF